ncbi:MAG: 16S rRNA (cytosine(967)-C(5))-methyltransferase RsmB [Deltaproteobacteria bacterium]|nr:16S rRNA (cytosine(967)-C(5))-methyltransferase RsmB [Deltaproteobacteria bacterium]
MPPNSRLISLSVLNEVDQDKKTLDQILDATFARIGNLPQREKNLIFTIVYGVLRHRNRLDWILGHFSRTGLNKLDSEVLNILRIGLFQVVHLTRIPTSAAVNTAVDLAKTLKKPWLVKFVNAVLRSAVSRYPELSPPDMENDPVSAISIEKSMPQWLISRWVSRFGTSQTLLLCDIINTIPPLTLRVNTLKTTRSDLLESGGIHGRCVEPTVHGPDGIRMDHPEDPVTSPIASMKGFREGFFQVQDEAAQLVTLLLDPKPGETVMDACAGMGGKTGHIAQEMKNTGKILALDISPDKLEKIPLEMSRLGISIVETRVHDLGRPPDTSLIATFDRVLLDAPCSGLGVLRRNPDIKWRASPDRLERCRTRQIGFLDHVSRFVRPSGVLVYAVCSMEPEENEAVVAAFLRDHSEFSVEKSPAGLSPQIRSLMNPEGHLRTFPHLHAMDGFFAVRFRRCA